MKLSKFFTIEGFVHLETGGKVYDFHNNLTPTAKMIINHSMAGDSRYLLDNINIIYLDGAEVKSQSSRISSKQYLDGNSKLKLTAILPPTTGDSEYLISKLQLRTGNIVFSEVDLSGETISKGITSAISIGWTIKPQ